jgi:hypothetical protein
MWDNSFVMSTRYAKREPQNRKDINVTLPPRQINWLRTVAQMSGRSVSAVLQDMLDRAINEPAEPAQRAG